MNREEEVVLRFGSRLTDAEGLPSVEEAVRKWWSYQGPFRDVALQRPLLDLASFHSSGYVREKAVKQLSRIDDGTELPFLLLRLNDWVPQVRDAARQAIEERMQPRYALYFVANVTLLARLRDRALFDRIARLVAASARDALLRLATSGSSRSGRAAFRLVVAFGNAAEVLATALRSSDVAIRGEGARRVMSLTRDEMLAPLERLLTDSVGSIRRDALAKWIATFPESATAKLTAALLDESASIRDLARFELRIDAAQFYRDAIASTSQVRPLASAIAGLAETGEHADAERLLPFLSHASPRIRRTAVRAVVKLGGEAYVDRVLDRLGDVSPGVSAQARKVFARYGATIDGEVLEDIFHGADRPHVRLNSLLLFDALPKWDGILQLVLAVDVVDGAERDIAVDLIRRWNARYNRSQATPSKSQLARLEAALAKVEDAIGHRLAADLRFTIQSFR